MVDAGVVVPLGAFTMITAIVVGRPLVNVLAKRWENDSKTPRIPSEVMNRLERIEQAVDAIAVEVERISEGQRFTTKLLSDAKPEASLTAGSQSQSGARQT